MRLADELAIIFLNNEIKQRISYGRRTITAYSPGYIIAWSNADKVWDVLKRCYKGETLNLDSNQVFAPFPKKQLYRIRNKLEPLPLYKFSFEKTYNKETDTEIIDELVDLGIDYDTAYEVYEEISEQIDYRPKTTPRALSIQAGKKFRALSRKEKANLFRKLGYNPKLYADRPFGRLPLKLKMLIKQELLIT